MESSPRFAFCRVLMQNNQNLTRKAAKMAKVEEQKECRNFSKLCYAKEQGKWEQNIVATSIVISQQRMK